MIYQIMEFSIETLSLNQTADFVGNTVICIIYSSYSTCQLVGIFFLNYALNIFLTHFCDVTDFAVGSLGGAYDHLWRHLWL